MKKWIILIVIIFCIVLTGIAFAAIDTENKRRSVVKDTLPVPDGSIDAFDRTHFAGFYRLGETTGGDGGGSFSLGLGLGLN